MGCHKEMEVIIATWRVLWQAYTILQLTKNTYVNGTHVCTQARKFKLQIRCEYYGKFWQFKRTQHCIELLPRLSCFLYVCRRDWKHALWPIREGHMGTNMKLSRPRPRGELDFECLWTFSGWGVLLLVNMRCVVACEDLVGEVCVVCVPCSEWKEVRLWWQY